MPSITGGHHVALTVTDADRSAEWYGSLLNMQVALSGDSEEVKFRVLADPKSGWVLGVRQYPARPGPTFDEFRTGLDHLAFGVDSRAELEAWEKELSARGITFTPIAETPIGSLIVFRDPDNIQLEFFLPAG
ncbi:MAG: VOC family protein [Streptosporangiaceae bacterium]|nr:VOC family protein [Streptosporangiaceae bacterium]